MTTRRTSDDATSGRGAVSRRRFLASAGVVAAGVTVVRPSLARGSSANSKVKIGLVGSGGRGMWIAKLFKDHGGYEVAAVSDYFQDRTDACGEELGVKPAMRFTGLLGYQRLIEQELDAIVIESPPYFHPEQAAAGVKARKHVYVAKPIAVDVPGCLSIEASGQEATRQNLCFLVDFQTRADQFYIEALQRVHAGALGNFAFGEATYHAEIPWQGQIKFLQDDPHNTENQLRAWGLSRVLSGDIITEQNIHTLDVASWIMNAPPICAYGTGGRKVREFGDCFDTFSVTYKYADDVGIAFSSRQFNGHGTQPEGIRNRMFGTEGVLETAYGGDVLIRGKNFWRGGSSPKIYADGAIANIAAFHKSIVESDWSNPTVAPSVRSNLVTILGRTAAYKGEVVTWEELLKCTEKLEADFRGLKS
ncbi:MAG: Gfo/Idh/MocA family oxidoreductase [Planctomycetes bacterium]|nr:Gfo/Idh/MocA family oxidoreductase [Planctomycetota bacterium]